MPQVWAKRKKKLDVFIAVGLLMSSTMLIIHIINLQTGDPVFSVSRNCFARRPPPCEDCNLGNGKSCRQVEGGVVLGEGGGMFSVVRGALEVSFRK